MMNDTIYSMFYLFPGIYYEEDE